MLFRCAVLRCLHKSWVHKNLTFLAFQQTETYQIWIAALKARELQVAVKPSCLKGILPWSPQILGSISFTLSDPFALTAAGNRAEQIRDELYADRISSEGQKKWSDCMANRYLLPAECRSYRVYGVIEEQDGKCRRGVLKLRTRRE